MSTHESHYANDLDERPHPGEGEPVVIAIIAILIGLMTPSIPIPPPFR